MPRFIYSLRRRHFQAYSFKMECCVPVSGAVLYNKANVIQESQRARTPSQRTSLDRVFFSGVRIRQLYYDTC